MHVLTWCRRPLLSTVRCSCVTPEAQTDIPPDRSTRLSRARPRFAAPWIKLRCQNINLLNSATRIQLRRTVYMNCAVEHR